MISIDYLLVSDKRHYMFVLYFNFVVKICDTQTRTFWLISCFLHILGSSLRIRAQHMCIIDGNCFQCCKETHQTGGRPNPSECLKVCRTKTYTQLKFCRKLSYFEFIKRKKICIYGILFSFFLRRVNMEASTS